MCDYTSMSISGDSVSDETLNQSPLALLLRRKYKFPSGFNIFIPSNYIFFCVICLFVLSTSLSVKLASVVRHLGSLAKCWGYGTDDADASVERVGGVNVFYCFMSFLINFP